MSTATEVPFTVASISLFELVIVVVAASDEEPTAVAAAEAWVTAMVCEPDVKEASPLMAPIPNAEPPIR